MEQIFVAYSLSNETVTSIMMLFSSTEVKVHSLDGDTDFFDIIASLLQEETLAPHLFIICKDYIF